MAIENAVRIQHLPRRLAALALLAIGAPLSAHVLYLMPSTFRPEVGERFVMGIHNGDAFPESEASPVMNRLRDLSYWTGGLEYNLLGVRQDGKRAMATGTVRRWGPVVVSAATIPHPLQLEAEAFEAYLREEGLDWVIQERRRLGEAGLPGREIYTKFAKSILISGKSKELGGMRRPIGQLLEFVPGETYGEETQFQLLFRGRPVEGVQVMLVQSGQKEQNLGPTNTKGIIRAKVNAPGIYRLHAIRMERRQAIRSGEAEWASWWASLTFQQDAPQ